MPTPLVSSADFLAVPDSLDFPTLLTYILNLLVVLLHLMEQPSYEEFMLLTAWHRDTVECFSGKWATSCA